jgi:pectin methylesterase-like acyl-CoA thioesterase
MKNMKRFDLQRMMVIKTCQVKLICLLIMPMMASRTLLVAQTFFIKENFSNANGINPPQGWQCLRLSGGSAAGFRFDNTTGRQLIYPLQFPSAIFDAVAAPMQGTSQVVALESPDINLSGTTRLLLSFDHQFTDGSEASGRVQTWSNNVWTDIATYTTSMPGAQTATFDVSATMAGKSQAKIRFLWSGKQTGAWVVDNVKLYAPLPVDAGITSIDIPSDPFGEGRTDVSVTLLNYGSSTLSSARIRWSVNNAVQRDTVWTGSLAFAQQKSGLRLGQVDMRAGVPYLLKIWTEDPNGIPDDNPSNDTIIRTLIPSLCGTYTIGGNNPNFPTITRAVEFLHTAGIGCPVVMKIRDGIYNEQLELKAVRGSSFVNTITFEGERGDSAKVLLTSDMNVTSYRYTLNLNGARNIRFRSMDFTKLGHGDYQAILVSGNSKNIDIRNCRFLNTINSTTGIYTTEQSDSVFIEKNQFLGIGYHAVNLNNNGTVFFRENQTRGWYYIPITGNSNNAFIENNVFDTCELAINVSIKDSGLISGNTMRRSHQGIRLSGTGQIRVDANLVYFNREAGIYTDAVRPLITNNWIYSRDDHGIAERNGIFVRTGNGTRVWFNSVLIQGGNRDAAALKIEGGDNIDVRGNVFANKSNGFAAIIPVRPRVLQLDRNGYYSRNKTVGRLEGRIIHKMTDWRTSINGESNGMNGDPGFKNDSTLVPSHIWLNAKGIPGTNIILDHLSNARNTSTPDIGATEFIPCDNDAALEEIRSPISPITLGQNQVWVVIRNNGLKSLKNATIRWNVDGITMTEANWVGNLEAADTISFNIGTFMANRLGGHVVSAHIVSTPDCNRSNDTAVSNQLYPMLCGSYTVGMNGDFKSLADASKALQNGGVSCPVKIRILDGEYDEEVRIDSVPGSSNINTITVESFNLDSSRVILRNYASRPNQLNVINIQGGNNFHFRHLTIKSTGDSRYSVFMIGGQSKIVKITNCAIESIQGDSKHIHVTDGCDSLIVLNNRFIGRPYMSIITQAKIYADISYNQMLGNHGYSVYGHFRKLNCTNNRIEEANEPISIQVDETAYIGENLIYSTNIGVRATGIRINVNGNRIMFRKFYGIISHAIQSTITNNWIFNHRDTDDDSQSGIQIEGQNARIMFNSIHLSRGNRQSTALKVVGGDSLIVSSNIFSVRKDAYPIFISRKPKVYTFDHNGYYSPQGKTGWLETNGFQGISTWRTAVGGEANGIFCNPYFVSDSTLTPAQVLLNATGATGTMFTKDIDGKDRSTTKPDIGAIEFEPCQTDAGLVSMLEPGLPLDIGVRALKIAIQNNGQSIITEARISYTINGSAVKDTVWKGTLSMGASDTMIIGSFNFRALTEYEVKVWMNLTNPSGDCLKANDTLLSQKLYARLCGDYTIGGINPDFKTFNDAVNFLRDAGISCKVVFKVRDGVYKEKFSIDSIVGSSSVNNVTFESESRNVNKVMITSDRLPSDPLKSTVLLKNARFIRFKYLNISQTGWDPGHPIVSVSGNSKDVLFEYMQFTELQEGGNSVVASENSDSVFIVNSLFRGQADHAIYLNTSGDVYVQNNHFGRSQRDGRFILGNAGKVFIQRNRMDSCIRGIEISTRDSASIIENNIREVSQGLILSGTAKYHIEANRINFTNGTGIQANGLRNARIINNWVYNTKQLSTNGILLTNCTETRLLFNTINITGTNNNSSAIAIEGGSNIAVFNNVLRNASGGYCMKLIGGTANLISDYNCYYAPLNNIGSLNDRIYNKLSLWGNLINGESNSLFINPFFRSITDYRPNHILLNDAGITINPVTRDIDSSLRHPISPDIGVKEFTPCNNDAGINEFSSPALPIGAGKQDIKVILQNQGLGTISSVRIHWSINGAVQTPFDWTGTLTTRKNTEVRIGSFDFIAGPEWTIRSWTTNPNGIVDCNFFNDTTLLFVAGTPNSVPFPPTAKDTSICRGNSVTLKASGVGKIGWYTAPNGGTWLGGDSLFTTPPLSATTIYYVQDSVTTASLARTAVRVSVFTPPPFNALPDMIYSKADSLALRADSTLRPAKHLWSTGDTTGIIYVKYTGGYRVHFTTPDGCRLTDSVFVRFPDSLVIRPDTAIGSCTIPVDVPITVSGFRRISRVQGEIIWDTAQLRFDAVIPQPMPSLGMKSSDFNTLSATTGMIRFAWRADIGQWKSLPDSTIIFRIRLIPHTGIMGNLRISQSQDTSVLKGYDDRPEARTMVALNSAIKVTTCNMILSGRVITPLDEGIRNVQMMLTGPDNRQTLTDSLGRYALTAARGNYTLTPYKNNETQKLNGLSTLDLALIQSHILFRQRLSNPYKVIAADVNVSSSVTTADIMHLRRLLLRMDTSLPGNQTWAFVDAEQSFQNPNLPFPIRRSKPFLNHYGPITQTFRGIKLGDVNYDRDPRLDRTSGKDTLKLYADVREMIGNRFIFAVKTEQIENLMGFQGTFTWDTTALMLESITANPLQVALNENMAENGNLPFSWNDPLALGLSFNRGSSIMDLVFVRRGNAAKKTILLTNELLQTEAFNGVYEKINMIMTPVSLEDQPPTDESLMVFPNPAKSRVYIRWRAEQKGSTLIRIYDQSLRSVYSRLTSHMAGINQFPLMLTPNISNGTYILQLESEGKVRSIQLVINR